MLWVLRLFKKAKQYIPHMLCVVALLFVITMCNLMLPRLMASLINDGIDKGDTGYLLRTGALIIGI